MEKDQNVSCTNIHLSLTSLYHRRIFLCYQRSPDLQVSSTLARAPQGSQCNHRQLWLFPFWLNTKYSAGCVGNLLLPEPRTEGSWNTILFPRGLPTSGFLHQALNRHNPWRDLVQKTVKIEGASSALSHHDTSRTALLKEGYCDRVIKNKICS